jgi:hypothetical protein
MFTSGITQGSGINFQFQYVIIMIKNNLDAPPIHPAAPTTPVDANNNPIYSNTDYYRTSGCIGIDGQSPISIAQTIALVQITKTIQQLSDLSKHASTVFGGSAITSNL